MEHNLQPRRSKRLNAMKHVQIVALRLFDESGFRSVTIDQIAVAAGVSESSVYRYFGTKEGIVLADPDFPNQVLSTDISEGTALANKRTTREIIEQVQGHLVAALSARAKNPIVQARLQYLVEVPDLRSALALDLNQRVRELTDMAAGDETSESTTSFEVEIAISATYGAILGALQHWMNVDFDVPLDELLDRAIERINTGLMADDSLLGPL